MTVSTLIVNSNSATALEFILDFPRFFLEFLACSFGAPAAFILDEIHLLVNEEYSLSINHHVVWTLHNIPPEPVLPQLEKHASITIE